MLSHCFIHSNTIIMIPSFTIVTLYPVYSTRLVIIIVFFANCTLICKNNKNTQNKKYLSGPHVNILDLDDLPLTISTFLLSNDLN